MSQLGNLSYLQVHVRESQISGVDTFTVFLTDMTSFVAHKDLQ